MHIKFLHCLVACWLLWRILRVLQYSELTYGEPSYLHTSGNMATEASTCSLLFRRPIANMIITEIEGRLNAQAAFQDAERRAQEVREDAERTRREAEEERQRRERRDEAAEAVTRVREEAQRMLI